MVVNLHRGKNSYRGKIKDKIVFLNLKKPKPESVVANFISLALVPVIIICLISSALDKLTK